MEDQKSNKYTLIFLESTAETLDNLRTILSRPVYALDTIEVNQQMYDNIKFRPKVFYDHEDQTNAYVFGPIFNLEEYEKEGDED